MGWILRELEKIDDLDERRAEAEKLLDRHRDDHVPRGIWYPGAEWDRLESVIQDIESGDRFFWNLEQLFGDDPPRIFTDLYERFRKEKIQMIRLTTMKSDERRKLPAYRLPPYFPDFDRVLRQSAYPRRGDGFNVDHVEFTTDMIAEGGFAEIYKVQGRETFALKLFFPRSKQTYYECNTGSYSQVVSSIMENVRRKADLISQAPFVPLRYAPKNGEWYVMDYFRGRCVKNALKCKELDKETAGRVLQAYAQMLKQLHESGYVFVDNNWGAVLFDDVEVGFCDYDFLSTTEEMAEEGYFTRKINTPTYSSREQNLEEAVTPASELESFGLMIDEMIYGSIWAPTDRLEFREWTKLAEENKRKYPAERRNRLPPQLKQVLPRLLTHPRDESVTSDDLLSAIQTDYDM